MSEYVFNYNQYKKTINTKSNLNFSIIFVIIIILLGSLVLIKPKQTRLVEFHFVEIDNFQTYQNALTLSKEINQSGGAGYIYFDGSYHVLASFYSNYNSAEKVMNNLKSDYPSSSIFSLSATTYQKQNNLTKKQNSSVANLFKESEKTIISLEHLSITFDKKELDFAKLQIEIKNLKETLLSSYDNFLKQFNTQSKYNVAKNYASQMMSSLNNLANETEQNMSASLKYELINIVVSRYQFLSCF